MAKNVFMTGWNTCVSNFELLPDFGMDDVQCLDASIFVPAGCTTKTEQTNSVVGLALYDVMSARAKWN